MIMKKILLILSIFGLFTLASCDDPDIYETTDSTKTIETSEEKETEKETVPEETTKTEVDLPTYDDGGDWHGTID